jgi:hypothetical protein
LPPISNRAPANPDITMEVSGQASKEARRYERGQHLQSLAQFVPDWNSWKNAKRGAF